MLLRAWTNCGIKVIGAWQLDNQVHQERHEQGRDYWTVVLQGAGKVRRIVGGRAGG